MNCKSRDLAIVMRDTGGVDCFRLLIGTPIRVEASFQTPFGHDAWTYSGPRLRCPRCDALVLAFLDADLQPIRGQRADTPSATEIMKTDEALA